MTGALLTLWSYYPLVWADIKLIGTWSLFWGILFVIASQINPPFKPEGLKLKQKDELDVKNRLVSFVHGFSMAFLSAYEFYFQPGSCGESNTPFERMVCCATAGYFLYDFVAMAYYKLLDGTMILHHSICLGGFTAALATGTGSNYTIMGLYVSEVSNTCMHIRSILKHYGLRYTKSYELMEISFILLYIYGRILLGPALLWSTTMCSHNHFMIRICAVALFG